MATSKGPAKPAARKSAASKTTARSAKTTAAPAAGKKPAKAAATKNAARKPAARKSAAKEDSGTGAAPAKAAPTHAEIAALAAHYWMERGHPEGSPEVDWARAEHHLRGL